MKCFECSCSSSPIDLCIIQTSRLSMLLVVLIGCLFQTGTSARLDDEVTAASALSEVEMSSSKCVGSVEASGSQCMSLLQSATHSKKVVVVQQDQDVDRDVDTKQGSGHTAQQRSPDNDSLNDIRPTTLPSSSPIRQVPFIQYVSLLSSISSAKYQAMRLVGADYIGAISIALVILLCLSACVFAWLFQGQGDGNNKDFRTSTRDVKIPQRQPLKPARKLRNLDTFLHDQSAPPSLASVGMPPRFGRSITPPAQSSQQQSSPPELSGALRESVDAGGDPYFCHDLVVPQFCECMLIVPIGPLNIYESYDVTDVNGSVVLQVALRSSPDTAAGSAVGQTAKNNIVLSTAQNENLATCCVAPRAATDPVEFQLLRAGGDYFASLRKDRQADRYQLTTITGMELHFWGNFEHFAVNISDDGAKLLATTEICQVDFDASRKGYYRLRLAPLTDVGLVLCSLLCIHHLQGGQFGLADSCPARP